MASTPEGRKDRSQVDWMISNLRWLLLVSVTLVTFADAFISHGGDIDLGYLLPLILLLVVVFTGQTADVSSNRCVRCLGRLRRVA